MIQTMTTTTLMILITLMTLAQVRLRVTIHQTGQAGVKDLNRHRRQLPVSAQRGPEMGSARQAQ